MGVTGALIIRTPRVHEFLHEMNREVFSKYDSMTVGEMSSTTADHCIRYTNPENKELDMTFNFHHLKVDYPNGEKWALAPFDFLKLKRILAFWQTEMQKGGGWNALFWCNHDQPRNCIQIRRRRRIPDEISQNAGGGHSYDAGHALHLSR